MPDPFEKIREDLERQNREQEIRHEELLQAEQESVELARAQLQHALRETEEKQRAEELKRQERLQELRVSAIRCLSTAVQIETRIWLGIGRALMAEFPRYLEAKFRAPLAIEAADGTKDCLRLDGIKDSLQQVGSFMKGVSPGGQLSVEDKASLDANLGECDRAVDLIKKSIIHAEKFRAEQRRADIERYEREMEHYRATLADQKARDIRNASIAGACFGFAGWFFVEFIGQILSSTWSGLLFASIWADLLFAALGGALIAGVCAAVDVKGFRSPFPSHPRPPIEIEMPRGRPSISEDIRNLQDRISEWYRRRGIHGNTGRQS